MISPLHWVQLDRNGLDELRTWFRDPELQRRISFPDEVWFDYVTDQPGNHAWMVWADDAVVGCVQVDIEYAKAYFSVIVKPDLRNRGFGRAMVRDLVTRPEPRLLEELVGTVEPDNTAGQRCLAAAGLVRTKDGLDEEGFLHFTYLMPVREFASG